MPDFWDYNMEPVTFGFKSNYYGNFTMPTNYYSFSWSGEDDWVFSKIFPNCSEVPEYIYDTDALKAIGNSMFILEWDALIPKPPSNFTEQQKRDHNKYLFDTYICPKYNSDNNFIKNEVENPSCSTSC